MPYQAHFPFRKAFFYRRASRSITTRRGNCNGSSKRSRFWPPQCDTWHSGPLRPPTGEEEKRDAETEGFEAWEIIYFKLYKSQIPVIEQALETAALMLGSDKSRGYCLEMIAADFLAGANLDSAEPDVLLRAVAPVFQFLPTEQKNEFLHHAIGNAA